MLHVRSGSNKVCMLMCVKVDFCSQSAGNMESNEQFNWHKLHPLEDEGKKAWSPSCKVPSSPQTRGREREQNCHAGGRRLTEYFTSNFFF